MRQENVALQQHIGAPRGWPHLRRASSASQKVQGRRMEAWESGGEGKSGTRLRVPRECRGTSEASPVPIGMQAP
jgi:hypothetical protein